MKKAKKTTIRHKKSPVKKSRNLTGNGVYWYGIHIHHIGLGVAAIGTIMIVILMRQIS